MTAILTVGGLGERARRCDERCHHAKQKKCVCVCGGRYHGVGSSAIAQEMLTRDWLGDEWQDRVHEIEAAGGSVKAAIQTALFPQGART